jgi:hypothetical protein
MRRLCVVLSALLIATVVDPGLAVAGPSTVYTRVLHAYQTTGRVPPCEFTSPQLASALNSVDTYGQQYYADFIGAIQTALTARASGVCSQTSRHPLGAVAHYGRGSSGQIPGAPALPSSITAPTRSGLPLLPVLLVALGALLAAAAAFSWWARMRGWEPGWATSWRHGAAEARYRARGTWQDLTGKLRR